jgi:polyribonucleotide nucleotidyltransferase
MATPRLEIPVGDRTLIVEIPGLATQASGEALVRLGDTVVLVTAVMSQAPRQGVDFFPLTVEFEEKYYAAGELRSSRFVKREAKPSDEALIAGRLVDRTIRPRFPKGMRNEVQVVATTLSYDGANDSDVLAIIGASTALMVSDIPWNGPVGGVRVASIEGRLVFFPTEEERERASFEVVVAGTEERVNMLEGGASEVAEDAIIDAIEKSHDAITTIVREIRAFAERYGKPKTAIVPLVTSEEARAAVRAFLGNRLEEALFGEREGKLARMDRVNALKRELREHCEATNLIGSLEADMIFEDEIDRLVHTYAIEKNIRVDGRGPTDIRPLSASVGYLPRTHGSAIFTRGETRALATVTLAAPGEELIVESMEGEWKKSFMLHYNFPPFSVGEVRPMRGPGRREIGHGALAERSVKAVIPKRETFPYTIRVVSEILSSNGSSSMATVCASSLALMDAGVPIARHVVGIAMGVMTNENGHYRILTDIQGPEDHHGDMDLKIAGTRKGITGIQMDVKIEGLTIPMLKEAFAQARKAHGELLELLEGTIAEPRPSVATYAPKIESFTINPEKIRDLIGPGGKVINGITERTGARIDIEDNGRIFVTAVDPEALRNAVAEVKRITREAAIGEHFEGTVVRIFPFGVMVEIFEGQEGLIHMNDLAPLGVRHPDDAFRVGQKVAVIVKERDAQGRLNLSLAEPEKLVIERRPVSPPSSSRPHPRRRFHRH